MFFTREINSSRLKINKRHISLVFFYEVEQDEEEVIEEESTLEPAVLPNLTPIRSPTKMSSKPRAVKKKHAPIKHTKQTEGSNTSVNGIPSPLCLGSYTQINRTTRRQQPHYQLRILYHNFLDKDRIWHR